MCLHIFSHGQYGNCLIIFQPFRILDTQSLRVSANLKPHLSGHANVKHHIVTTKRATCVGIPTAEINWCVVTIFLPLKVPVITFPQVQIPTNVPAYKTINKPQLISLKFLSPKNAPLNCTYKILKYTARLSHYCSYMFRPTWTIIREPMPNLAKVIILWK